MTKLMPAVRPGAETTAQGSLSVYTNGLNYFWGVTIDVWRRWCANTWQWGISYWNGPGKVVKFKGIVTRIPLQTCLPERPGPFPATLPQRKPNRHVLRVSRIKWIIRLLHTMQRHCCIQTSKLCKVRYDIVLSILEPQIWTYWQIDAPRSSGCQDNCPNHPEQSSRIAFSGLERS